MGMWHYREGSCFSSGGQRPAGEAFYVPVQRHSAISGTASEEWKTLTEFSFTVLWTSGACSSDQLCGCVYKCGCVLFLQRTRETEMSGLDLDLDFLCFYIELQCVADVHVISLRANEESITTLYNAVQKYWKCTCLKTAATVVLSLL